MSHSSTVAAVLGASILLLTACGGGGEDTAAATHTSSSSAEATSSSAAETTEESAGAVPAGDVAAPGTALGLGESAVLELEYLSDGGTGTVEVTVDAIRQGTQAELDTLELGADAVGLLPWYVDVTLTRVGGDDDLANGNLDSDLDVYAASGSSTSSIIEFSTFEPCNGESAPDPFDPGTSYSTCILVAADAADQVTTVEYAPFDSDYEDSPVVWTV